MAPTVPEAYVGPDPVMTDVPAATLRAEGYSKAFGGIIAVDSVTFEAWAGEVHALLGENGAGKSTFVKMLGGVVQPDAGHLSYKGVPLDPSEARHHQKGAVIGVVFQELSLIPDLSVAENIWIAHQPTGRLGTVSTGSLRRRTLEFFDQLGIEGINPDREARDLSIADRHMVETAKVLSLKPEIVIFDEATSALAPHETAWTLKRMRMLAEDGCVVLMISHRMAEVRAVADRVTVFRNGQTVAVRRRNEYDEDELLSLMLARKVEQLYPDRVKSATDKVALRVSGLSSGRRLQGVDLELREGEVLGVGGLDGQGQGPLFAGLYGLLKTTGAVELFGKPIDIREPRVALRAQPAIAFVPEDRKLGLLLSKSVLENLTLPILDRLSRFGFVDRPAERALVERSIEQLNIAASSPDQEVQALSGGNQQKVALARVLLTEARVLLLYDPTRGVDVGTKAQIFALIRDLAKQGYSILFHSTDASELANVADRVVVLREGRVSAVLEGSQLTEDEILRWAVTETLELTESAQVEEAARVAASRSRIASLLGHFSPLAAAPWAILLALYLTYVILQPRALSLQQVGLLAVVGIPLLLVACGQTIVILTGGIDLSVGGMLSLATTLVATQMKDGSIIQWTLLVLAVGALGGALNGLLITRARLQPFVATLGTWSIFSGVALLVLETQGGHVPAGFTAFAYNDIAGIPLAVFFVVGLLLAWSLVRRTRLLRRMYAVGSSEESSFLSGVPVRRTKTSAYMLSGIFAAAAGLALTMVTSSGDPVGGTSYILPSIAAVVIGGASLLGGRGGLPGTVVGALILTMIADVVFVVNLPEYWTPVIQGVLIVLAVLAGAFARSREARRQSSP